MLIEDCSDTARKPQNKRLYYVPHPLREEAWREIGSRKTELPPYKSGSANKRVLAPVEQGENFKGYTAVFATAQSRRDENDYWIDIQYTAEMPPYKIPTLWKGAFCRLRLLVESRVADTAFRLRGLILNMVHLALCSQSWLLPHVRMGPSHVI